MAELVRAPDGIFPKSLMMLYYTFFVLQGLINLISSEDFVISGLRILIGLIGLLSTNYETVFLTYGVFVSLTIFGISIIIMILSLFNVNFIQNIESDYLFYLGAILSVTIGWYYYQTERG